MLNLAKAQSEDQNATIAELKREVEAIKALPATVVQGPGADGTDVIDALRAELEELRSQVSQQGDVADDISPIEVERDADGLITRIAGRQVVRDENGLTQRIV